MQRYDRRLLGSKVRMTSYILWEIGGVASWPFWLCLASLTCNLWPRLRTAAVTLLALAVAAFVILGWLPAAQWLARSLEGRFPPVSSESVAVDHIIVLTGAEAMASSDYARHPEFNSGAERITEGAALARLHPGARLWIVGGVGGPGAVTDTDWTKSAWLRLGVEASQISVLQGTHNTWQNVDAIARQHLTGRLLLVTSAMHMPRAMACFEAAGLPIEPYPVDFLSTPGAGWSDMLTPSIAGNLMIADQALREWLALIIYRVASHTRTVLPTSR